MNDPIPSPDHRSRLRLHPALWLFGLAVFSLPALAMLMTREVVWGYGDFLVFGAMLTSFLGVIEFAISRQIQWGLKALAVAVILVVFIVIWVELAVGIFD